MKKILIVDDEDSVRYSFRKLFRDPEYTVLEAANGREGLTVFSREKPDLVLLDIEMPVLGGIEAIQRMKKMAPEIPVLIITAFGTTERVIAAMKYGAYDYLEKPFDVPRLKMIVKEALAMEDVSRGELVVGPESDHPDVADRIVGNSFPIKEVYKMIGRVAASDVSVLLVGESGTGKELVAKAIHKFSNRADKPFLTINCAAIPDSLLESELFGYEKGAFTDAKTSREGKFETADHGTLFLDEIGDMSLTLQAKLLRVLQEGTFERLGSSRSIHADVRVVAATNKNLEAAIQSKDFREDLYYRLKVITITLPPLRMRPDDIPLLVRYFLAKHGHLLHKPGVTLPQETMDKLMSYHWPGNIRELENMIKRAMLLSKSHMLTPDLFESDQPPVGERAEETGSRPLSSFIPDDLSAYEGHLYRHVIENVERELIRLALARNGGNQMKTARFLGISRVMLHERMEKYGLLA
jgi:DNA-binding NtrC family response regulator